MTLSRDLQGQNYFNNDMKTLFTIFHCVDTYMMVKKQWWIKLWELSTIKGVAPSCPKSHCALHWYFHLRMFLMKE